MYFLEEWDVDTDESDKDEKKRNSARQVKSSRCRRRTSSPGQTYVQILGVTKIKIHPRSMNRVDDLMMKKLFVNDVDRGGMSAITREEGRKAE